MPSSSDYTELFKLIKAKANSKASLFVGENTASVRSSNGKNFFSAHETGVSIGGSLSYQGLPNQIKFGAISSFAPFPLLFLPIGPTLVPSLPLQVVPLIKLTRSLASLLG